MKIILLTIVIFFINIAIADNKSGKIQRLDKKIDNISAQIIEYEISKDNHAHKLKKIETEISSIGAKLAKLQQEYFDLTVQIKAKQRQNQKNKITLNNYRKKLIKQIQAEYKIGSIQTISLILNQKSPQTLARALNYAKIFNNYRKQQINKSRNLYKEVLQNLSLMKKAQDQLKTKQHRLQKQQNKLDKAKKYRQNLLTTLDQDIQYKNNRLQRFKHQKIQLGNVINNTQKNEQTNNNTNHKTKNNNNAPITKYKGKLMWPTKGYVAHKYNSKKGIGDLRYQGIVINAKDGNNVKAIYDGEVVYTGWLSGYGNIIIISHQRSYISLYGYNQTILKNIGDWVKTGDKIAKVGKSGGQKKTSLYFEIRKKTKTLNPIKWIK
ncbi:MAG: hypothetical protein DRQ51_03340 [Gammaproteobacteria bacterium]|nr:MAG: hypothetical protein DRQ51_03340 [Gammaproteobacteria bacterium]